MSRPCSPPRTALRRRAVARPFPSGAASRPRRGRFRLAAPLLAILLAAGPAGSAWGFAAEDPMGNPTAPGKGFGRFAVKKLPDGSKQTVFLDGVFHHENLGTRAALGAGFDDLSAHNLAWATDYIDSYLYNPLFWIQGQPPTKRYVAAMAMMKDLEKVHFDELFYPDAVRENWRRILNGTMAGVVWAWREGDPAAAQNVVAISMHAIQDFYAHSSWLNEMSRHGTTWFEMPAAGRANAYVFTGAYEMEPPNPDGHHGKILPSCSVLGQPSVLPAREWICHAASPYAGTELCEYWEQCEGTVSQIWNRILGVPTPESVLYYRKGIAIDARWLAPTAVEMRGLTGQISPDDLFDRAHDLALRSSQQWLEILEGAMGAIPASTKYHGKTAAQFWADFKHYESSVEYGGATPEGGRTEQFEDFTKFPFLFLSTGPHPTPVDPMGRYFLRVEIGTGTAAGAGTDGDIVLEAGGKSFPLDYVPGSLDPIKTYNDFEAGQRAVYFAGPLNTKPSSLKLRNNAPNLDSLQTILMSLEAQYVDDMLTDLQNMPLWGADKVGSARLYWSPSDLAGVGSSAKSFSKLIDGDSEGKYRVRGEISRKSSSGGETKYHVRLTKLECVEESAVDGLTTDDEPFLLSALIVAGEEPIDKMFGPFTGVDTGESRNLTDAFPDVTVSDAHGSIALPLMVMESDNETPAHRQTLLEQFVEQFTGGGEEHRIDVIQEIGRAVAADWQLGQVEVYAFTRDEHVEGGVVHSQTHNHWIHGGDAYTISLSGNLADYGAPLDLDRFVAPAGGGRLPIDLGDLTKKPPIETPPGKTPPIGTPPVRTPPADNPPVKLPIDLGDLGKTPPAKTPPAKTPPAKAPAPPPPVSFPAATLAMPQYGYSAGGWRVEKNPRLVGDVNGDGRADIVGFGNAGTYLTLATVPSRNPRAGGKGAAAAGPFQETGQALTSYGYDQGWRVEKHVRVLGDVNGDGKDDIVAFHDEQTYLSLSTGSGFAKPQACGTGLGYGAGWRVEAHVRALADVNGDGKDDIVAFGPDGTHLAPSTGAGFGRPSMVLPAFGAKQGWDGARHERVLADVNGDGRADIVGFGEDGTWVAVSSGSAFGRPALAVKALGAAQGWSPGEHARLVGDVNGDGMADLVGCGTGRTELYLSTGKGFANAEPIVFFHSKAGWQAGKHPRFLADVNGDGKADLVGCGGSRTFVALSRGDGFEPGEEVSADFSYAKGWRIENHPRFVADFDGDGRADLLGFGNAGTYLAAAK